MMPTILITGSLGQIGTELTPLLLEKGYTVIASDIRPASEKFIRLGIPFETIDTTNRTQLAEVVQKYNVDIIIHNASILSAVGEQYPQKAIHVNIRGIENILEVARENNVKKVISPSSIAAFGPNTPKDDTPNDTIMRPDTIYGISKVYTELLGEYYHKKYNVDFRTLRYPGIISADAPPGGGTTDWAVQIFYDALQKKRYTCFVREDTRMPMMSMPDCLNSTIELLEADEKNLQHRSFNVGGCNFTPVELTREIQKYIPEFTIEYAPDYRQTIAASWPSSIDDSVARQEWNWKAQHDIEALTKYMLKALSEKLNIPVSIE